MDDYESGTWTPTIIGGTLAISVINKAVYVKIGKLVTVQAYITVDNGGNAALLQIGGLPFAAESNGYSTGVFNHSHGSNTLTKFIRSQSGAAVMNVYKDNNTQLAQSEADGGWFIFSLSYQTA